LYITGGSGSIIADGKEHIVMENDMYLFQPEIYHEIFSCEDNPMKAVELKFITEDLRLINGMKRLPIHVRNNSAKIRVMFNNLVGEALNKKPFYKEVITANTIELLLQLFRMHSLNTYGNNESILKLMIDEPNTRHELANRLLKYIHKNYTRKITLEELSRSFNINKEYLCRVFKKVYGVSPIHYVNYLRLEKAKDLLSETDLSVTEISELVGFNSIHYLSRYFTEKEGITPIEFRQRSVENVNIDVDEQYKIVDYKI
jgi:AraC-like DNA-binding protein